MTTRDEGLIITYAHCRKWTHGQLDCEPYSAYALVSISVVLQSRTHNDETDYYVLVNGERIGIGASASEAIEDSRWALMNESRKQAQAAAATEGSV